MDSEQRVVVVRGLKSPSRLRAALFALKRRMIVEDRANIGYCLAVGLYAVAHMVVPAIFLNHEVSVQDLILE